MSMLYIAEQVIMLSKVTKLNYIKIEAKREMLQVEKINTF